MTSTHLMFLTFALTRLGLVGGSAVGVADAAASLANLAMKVVGLAADAAIGTVRIAGKVAGSTADPLLPGSTP